MQASLGCVRGLGGRCALLFGWRAHHALVLRNVFSYARASLLGYPWGRWRRESVQFSCCLVQTAAAWQCFVAGAHVCAALICRRLAGDLRVAVHASDRGLPLFLKSALVVAPEVWMRFMTSAGECCRRVAGRCATIDMVSLARAQECLVEGEHASMGSAIVLSLYISDGLASSKRQAARHTPVFLIRPLLEAPLSHLPGRSATRAKHLVERSGSTLTLRSLGV